MRGALRQAQGKLRDEAISTVAYILTPASLSVPSTRKTPGIPGAFQFADVSVYLASNGLANLGGYGIIVASTTKAPRRGDEWKSLPGELGTGSGSDIAARRGRLPPLVPMRLPRVPIQRVPVGSGVFGNSSPPSVAAVHLIRRSGGLGDKIAA